MTPMRWYGAIVVLVGASIALAWGARAGIMYVFLAGFAALVVLAASTGGDLVQRWSRSRFDHDRPR
jgi:hypothetical protein